MGKIIQNQQGFTLVETLTAIAISMILMAGIAGVLSTSVRASNQSKIQIELQQEARFAVDSIVRDLQLANNVEIDESNPSHIIISNQNVIPKVKIEYLLQNNILYRFVNGVNSQPVTGGSNIPIVIKSLIFHDPAPDHPGEWKHTTRRVEIIMEVTADDKITNSKKHYTIETAVTLLAHPLEN